MTKTKTAQKCVICNTDRAEMWWKCCPVHCTEQGPDVICGTCVIQVHGLCILQGCDKVGVEAVSVSFACIEDDGVKIYKDRARQVFFCEEHKGTVLILEEQL